MRMDIFTLPLMRTVSKLLCAAYIFALIGHPASAQDGKRRAAQAQAQLQLNVIVQPVVIPPHRDKDKDRDRDRGNEGITYNLYPELVTFSVTHEVRMMLVDAKDQGAREEQVQQTTIVTK